MSKRRNTAVSETSNKRLRSVVNGENEDDDEDQDIAESEQGDSAPSKRVGNVTAAFFCNVFWGKCMY